MSAPLSADAPARCDAPEPVALCPSLHPSWWPHGGRDGWCHPAYGHALIAYIEWRDAQARCPRALLFLRREPAPSDGGGL